MNQMPAFVEEWVSAFKRTNQFVAARWEQWAGLQMESLKAHADLGLSQVKVALKVSDLRNLREFADSQFAVMSFVGHRMMDDAQLATEWGAENCRQADRLARQNLLKLILK